MGKSKDKCPRSMLQTHRTLKVEILSQLKRFFHQIIIPKLLINYQRYKNQGEMSVLFKIAKLLHQETINKRLLSVTRNKLIFQQLLTVILRVVISYKILCNLTISKTLVKSIKILKKECF